MLFRIFTVLAVAALAISTWILSSPAHRPATTSGDARADLPGYYLKTAVLTDFDAAGLPTIRMEADRIDQIDHSTEVALSNVRVRYEAPNGQDWLLTGDTARVQTGGKVIDVAGNVELQGAGSAQAATEIVRSDALTYEVAESVVTTKSDVRLEFGAHELTGHGMTASLKDRTIHLDSPVHGRFTR